MLGEGKMLLSGRPQCYRPIQDHSLEASYGQSEMDESLTKGSAGQAGSLRFFSVITDSLLLAKVHV